MTDRQIYRYSGVSPGKKSHLQQLDKENQCDQRPLKNKRLVVVIIIIIVLLLLIILYPELHLRKPCTIIFLENLLSKNYGLVVCRGHITPSEFTSTENEELKPSGLLTLWFLLNSFNPSYPLTSAYGFRGYCPFCSVQIQWPWFPAREPGQSSGSLNLLSPCCAGSKAAHVCRPWARPSMSMFSRLLLLQGMFSHFPHWTGWTIKKIQNTTFKCLIYSF